MGSLPAAERAILDRLDPNWRNAPPEKRRQLSEALNTELRDRQLAAEQEQAEGLDASIAAIVANYRKDDFWPIWFPRPKDAKPKTILVGDGSGEHVYKKTVYTEKHQAVPEALLPAFCALHNLNLAQMINMLSGNAQEHRGFRRWNGHNLAANKWSSIPGRALGQAPPRYTQEDYAEMWGQEEKTSYLDRKSGLGKEPATVYFHEEPVEIFSL
jgi:hypothetical protein